MSAWRRGDCEVSDDPARIDLARVLGWIGGQSYWAAGIPRETMERAIRHSLCLGVYRGHTQVGFARVVTDRATYAYLCDVWIDAGERGRGLGRWLVECVLAHPDLQGLRRMSLLTSDAQGLYEKFGFRPLADPDRYRELHRPDVYQ